MDRGARALLLGAAICLAVGNAHAGDTYPYTLFQRIAGVPLSAHRPDFAEWQALIQKRDWETFARRAAEEDSFLEVTAVQWATFYYTDGKAGVIPLDDAVASLIGSVRDNLD